MNKPRSEAQVACDFWLRVVPSPKCWERPPAVHERGYGSFFFRGRREFSHRVSWLLLRGEIPEGMFVCHRCDNPACVRPDHLFLGTARDNTQDMIKKGRSRLGLVPDWARARGKRNGSSKLDETQVRALRAEYATGKTSFPKLAQKYGVSIATAHRIVTFKIWTWVK